MRHSLKIALILAALIAPAPLAAEDVAVTGARVLLGDGTVIQGGTVLIRNGKILRVYKGPAPRGVRLLNYPKATIIPGLVAASTMATITGDANEQSSEITPDFEIAGTLDPTSRDNRACNARGITTAYVRPGLANVIGGFGAVIHPGEQGKAFLARKRSELLIPVGPWPARGNGSPSWGVQNPRARRPSTRLATIWLIRKSFYDAKKFLRSGSIEGLEKEVPGAYTRKELEVLAGVLQGKVLLRWYAQTDKDVHTIFRLIDEFGIKHYRIEGLIEGYRGPKRLDTVKTGLIAEVVDIDPLRAGQALGLPMPIHKLMAYWRTGHKHAGELCQFCPSCARAGRPEQAQADGLSSRSTIPAFTPQYGYRANNFSVLIKRNPKLALSTGERIPDLLAAATLAVRHGLSRKQALAAITRIPAEILGLQSQVGTITPGKRGDLVILSGAPFEFTTRILAVLSRGKVVYPRTGN